MSMNQDSTTWHADDSPSVVIAIEPPPTADVQTIHMTLDVARRTGFRFNLDFLAPDVMNCYRVEITVEWAGENTIYLPISPTWRGEKITNPLVRSGGDVDLKINGKPFAEYGYRNWQGSGWVNTYRNAMFLEYAAPQNAGPAQPEECRIFGVDPSALQTGTNSITIANKTERALTIGALNLALW